MNQRKFFRTNQYIRAEKVRVISEDGKQIGIMPPFLALQKANEAKKDLVEIAPKASPPVCKIIDFKKFKYQLSKKESESRKKGKQDQKEIRLTPFIAENDLLNRLKRARKFIKEAGSVKVSVRYKGRQITKKDFGYQVLAKATEQLADVSQVDKAPILRGKTLIMTLTKKVNNEPESKKKDQN